MAPAPVIWRFTDGRAGHDNQSLGLVRALARRMPISAYDLRVRGGGLRALADWLARRSRPGRRLPDPGLLLGAGHATHLPMLAAARARGGRTVVLMRPSVPLRCFDLCLVPAHDGVAPGPGVISTRGALNAVVPETHKDADTGLLLLGGPSRHCRWDSAEVVAQVRTIVERGPARRWTVAGSPRTPGATLDALGGLALANLALVPFADTAPGWLAGRLARTPVAWVSADSVSMVYEALTAGAATGVIEIRCRSRSRVHRGLAGLLAAGTVVPFSAWREGTALRAPDEPLDEAGRCADWIIDRWLSAA